MDSSGMNSGKNDTIGLRIHKPIDTISPCKRIIGYGSIVTGPHFRMMPASYLQTLEPFLDWQAGWRQSPAH
jgi:hypothetical protein